MIVGRLIALLPVLIGVSMLTFFAVSVLPGSAAQQLLGFEATEAQVEELQTALRLDRPAAERYWEWIMGVVRGDFGTSVASGIHVSQLIRERFPPTLQLVLYAMTMALGLSLAAATASAWKPRGIAERFGKFISMAALSTPNYVIALVLTWLLSVKLRLMPSMGYVPFRVSPMENFGTLLLPALAVALPLFGLYSRYLYSELVAEMGKGYALAASARGIRRRRILFSYALPNATFGLLNLLAVHFGAIIGGTVIIEQLFAIPGLGRLLLQSVQIRDYTTVQAIVLLLALSTVLANLVVDLFQHSVDRRGRLERRT